MMGFLMGGCLMGCIKYYLIVVSFTPFLIAIGARANIQIPNNIRVFSFFVLLFTLILYLSYIFIRGEMEEINHDS